MAGIGEYSQLLFGLGDADLRYAVERFPGESPTGKCTSDDGQSYHTPDHKQGIHGIGKDLFDWIIWKVNGLTLRSLGNFILVL